MIQEKKQFTFYRKSSFGLSTWTLWYEGSVIYYGHCISEGGAMVLCEEPVTLNNSGRNLQAQIELQMRSRLSRMLDRGYKSTREEALLGATNQMGYINPMLAQPLQKIQVPEFGLAHTQRKYNGHRCLLTRQDGEIIPYTRKGKRITTIHHIVSKIANRMPEGATLDGELYAHGRSLQSISSLIKRQQDASLQLCYHLYDIAEDSVFSERLKYLNSIIEPISCESIHVVPTYPVKSIIEAKQLTDTFIKEGYEGGMLRLDLRGYEDGKRSDQLIKLKLWLDDDFPVVGVKAGKYGVAIFVLKLPNGKTFDCLAPGPVEEKQKMFIELEKYIGKLLKVQYANLTDDGKPFNATAVEFVEEL